MTKYVKYSCSGNLSKAWKKLTGNLPPWEGCCHTHDHAYEAGGSKQDRLDADNQLYHCVSLNGNPIWAWIIYGVVRVGGSPKLSNRWVGGYETLL